jgi:hypothetical protein
MTTIALPPDLEGRLADAARRRGATPELLALAQRFKDHYISATFTRGKGEDAKQYKRSQRTTPRRLAESSLVTTSARGPLPC